MKQNSEESTDIVRDEGDTGPDIEVVETDPQLAIKRLHDKLKACESEKQEFLDGWQRSRADFVNARRRDDERVKEMVEYAHQSLLEELIPVLDSIATATGNRDTWEKVDASWRGGVEQIFLQFHRILEKEGLSISSPLNEKYDPAKHEAVGTVPVEDETKDHIVLEVASPGYYLKGKLIRAPRVRIG